MSYTTINIESVKQVKELFHHTIGVYNTETLLKHCANTTGIYHYANGDWSGYNAAIIRFLNDTYVNGYPMENRCYELTEEHYRYLVNFFQQYTKSRPACLIAMNYPMIK